ncbi:hypothetical protein T09_8299 [Trichinella sp. T9]|nr:hypothetical protein T09_15070 [Trichinella sp. T9]KRX51715.1 hypothetical protein T09_8299 [Trichinella sp. T9]
MYPVNIIEMESIEVSCDARFRVQSLYCNIWLRLDRSKFVRFNESSKLVMNNNIERCEQHIVYTMISLQNHFQLSNKDFETPVEFNDHVKPRYQVIMPAKFLFIKGIRRCSEVLRAGRSEPFLKRYCLAIPKSRRLYISVDEPCFMYFSDHFNALNTNLECIHRRQRNDFLHHPLLKLRIRFRNRPHRDAEVSATCYLSLPENEDCEKAWA